MSRSVAHTPVHGLYLKPSLDNQGLSRDNPGYCLAKTLETIRGCVMTTLGVSALKPLVSNLTFSDNAT